MIFYNLSNVNKKANVEKHSTLVFLLTSDLAALYFTPTQVYSQLLQPDYP